MLITLIPTGPWMFGFHPALMIGTLFLWFASLVWFWLALDRKLEQREWLEATVSNLQYVRELEEQFPVES